jgi:hypothetical protein
MPKFRDEVLAELASYKTKGKTCPSWHQAYGLIAEELDEFWDEVKKKDHKRDPKNALKELVQIAALCEHAAQQLKLAEE